MLIDQKGKTLYYPGTFSPCRTGCPSHRISTIRSSNIWKYCHFFQEETTQPLPLFLFSGKGVLLIEELYLHIQLPGTMVISGKTQCTGHPDIDEIFAFFPGLFHEFLQKDDDGGRIILIRNDTGDTREMAGRTLKKKIRESIVAILTRYGAERIAIFGSYARGEAGGRSDIDILIRFARPKSLIQLVQIEDEIRKSIHMKVDLVTEKAVSPHFAGTIHRDEMVIFG
jgi:predicted nucleotidyltransferase